MVFLILMQFINRYNNKNNKLDRNNSNTSKKLLMKVLKNIRDNIFFNLETNFKPDLGREDALEQFENETSKDNH